MGYNPNGGAGLSLLFLFVVYALIYGTMWQLDRRQIESIKLMVNKNELAIAILIAAGAFALSNLSYVATNTL